MNNIYLDNSGSTKVLDTILETYNVIVNEMYANSSAVHTMGNNNMNLFKEARKQVASLCACRDSEITFTSGASESINTVLKGVSFYNMSRKKHIITTTLEHPSVYESLTYLQERFGIDVTYIAPINGEINVSMIEDAIREDTILVSVVHIQSEMGLILPIEEIGRMLRKRNVLFHVDACQSFGKIAIDFSKYDMISVSFHKLHGLKGSGFLYVSDSVKIDPLIHGGNQQSLRSGTIPLELCVCGAKAVRIALDEMNNNYNNARKLWNHLFEYFSSNNDVTVNSSVCGSPYIMNISISDIHIAAFSRVMWERGFIFSTKTACSSDNDYSSVIYDLFKDENRAKNSIRISISKFNTMDEIDALISCFDKVIQEVRGNKCG